MIAISCLHVVAALTHSLFAQTAVPTLQPQWAPYVQLQEMQLQQQDNLHEATGKLAYDEDHTQWVHSPLAGRVIAVHVALGASVDVGDALVTLASPEATQLWGEAQRAKLALKTAQKNTARVHALKRDGVISEREVQAAEAEQVLAASAARSAEEHLEALGLSVEGAGHHAIVRAHISGRVTHRHVAVGQEVRVDGQDPLLIISNLDKLWLLADVFEQDLDQIALGSDLKLQVPAYPGQEFKGTVEHIADFVDAQSRTIKVRASVDNAARKLKPDMFAAVGFVTRTKDALFVPSQALVTDGGSTAVIIVEQGEHLAVRPVVVGPLNKSKYRIISGITKGERVVTRGAPFVLQSMRE